MADCKPNPGKYKPYDIADNPQWSGSQIIFVCQLFSAYCFLAKREKSEVADHKTGFTPWNSNNGYIGNYTDNPPKQAHDQATKYKPEEISNSTHNLHLINN